jgi:hypothetical protein
MNDSRFDIWTRRRFGLAAGGALAALARLASPEDADGKKDKEKNKSKKRKKRCRKVGQVCRQSGKRKQCCTGKACADFDGQTFRCCKNLGQSCTGGGECCSGWCIEDACGVT